MSEPKTTIDLPFTKERVANAGKYDKAWENIMNDPDLAFARQRLSFHELRRIVEAVAQAFTHD